MGFLDSSRRFDNQFVKCKAIGTGVGVYTWGCSIKNRRQLSCKIQLLTFNSTLVSTILLTIV